MDITHFKALLENLRTLPKIKTAEPNIFAIGSRGYYENPTTDILAFFCDTQGPHGLGSLVLEALIDCLPADSFQTNTGIELITPPEREVRTKLDKRIDLIINGIDWVIILENKIYHHQNNPFLEYEAFADKQYKGKQKIYIVLSPSGESVKSNWHGISYHNLLISLKNKLGEHFTSQAFNKWVLLLREFILHLESFMSKTSLPNEHINFIFDNIENIAELGALKNKVVSEYQQKLQLALSTKFECGIGTRLHSWNEKPAMRFYLEDCKNQAGAVLFHKEGSETRFSINFYFLAKDHNNFDDIDNLLPDFAQLENWVESSGKYRCFREHLKTTDFEEIVNQLAKRLQQIDEYEKS